MRLPLIQKYTLHLLIIILFISCDNDNPQKELLQQAQDSLAIGKPSIALNLLTSIQNPEKMDKDSYMQYIVTYVGSKYETKADIINDTLILDAQRYFNKKKKSEYTPLSNYYAAQFYDESGNFPQALESYMYAVYAANKSNNDLLAGKSFNNIGYIYFGQGLLDSAIINYEKALLHYGKVDNIEGRKLKTLTNIGRTFEEKNNLDSAYFYFDRSLSLAEETQDEEYKFHSLKNLGAVCIKKEDYSRAINYFETALALNFPNEIEVRKIHLALLKIYNRKGDLKLAKQYADLVTEDLSETSSIYTIKGIYNALADYHRQLGDYKKALEYRDLENATNEEIEVEKNVPALLEADKSFYLAEKDREVQQFRSDIYLLLIVGAVIICIVLVFIVFIWNDNKKRKSEIREYADRYDEIKVLLFSMGEKYPKIEAEIKSMLEDD